MTSWLGPFGPGFLRTLRENSRRYSVLQRSMEAQQRGGSQDDRRTDQPPRADEEPTPSGDDPIRQAKIGCTFSGTIEDQQLLLDEHRFGHHGTRAAGTGEADDRCQQMQKKDGEIAHTIILATPHNPQNGRELAIRHAHSHNSGPFHAFALCRPVPLLAGLCCSQRARKGQPFATDLHPSSPHQEPLY